MTRLSTPRLLLRPWREEDAADLYLYASDPRVGPAAGWPPHRSEEESAGIIRTVFAAPETYAVSLRETGRVVGCVGLLPAAAANIPIGDADFEAGYWIGVPYWGRGLIPEAMEALMRRAFGELGAERLWCTHYDGNEKSRRVQEKCGFRPVCSRTVRHALTGEECLLRVSCIDRAQWAARRE